MGRKHVFTIQLIRAIEVLCTRVLGGTILGWQLLIGEVFYEFNFFSGLGGRANGEMLVKMYKVSVMLDE